MMIFKVSLESKKKWENIMIKKNQNTIGETKILALGQQKKFPPPVKCTRTSAPLCTCGFTHRCDEKHLIRENTRLGNHSTVINTVSVKT